MTASICTQSEFGQFLGISVGTGPGKVEENYEAKSMAKWGVFCRLMGANSVPLVDVFVQGSADMVDFHLSMVFKALNCESNYLRIQVIHDRLKLQISQYGKDDTLRWTISTIDTSMKENLNKPVNVGKELLKKPVTKVNLGTGNLEPSKLETNEQALRRWTRFAKILVEDRRHCHARQSKTLSSKA